MQLNGEKNQFSTNDQMINNWVDITKIKKTRKKKIKKEMKK